MKVIVYENEWMHGTDTYAIEGQLFDGKKRCCIGFLAQQLEVTDDKCLGEIMLMDVIRAETAFTVVDDGNGISDAGFIELAYKINDVRGLSLSDRKSILKSLFKINGHEMEFRESRPLKGQTK